MDLKIALLKLSLFSSFCWTLPNKCIYKLHIQCNNTWCNRHKIRCKNGSNPLQKKAILEIEFCETAFHLNQENKMIISDKQVGLL